MTKRGPTPSLIGGGAGASKLRKSPGTRHCKRCDIKIEPGTICFEVAIPGAMGHKNYCHECFGEILEKSQVDLNKKKEEWNSCS